MSLPPNWEIRECKDYPGRVYFFDTVKHVSTWIRPVPGPGNSSRSEWPPAVYVHHILVKHVDCRDDKTWKNVPVTRTRDGALGKIQNILRDIDQRGVRFEDIARDESDSRTHEKGGSLGWITRGTMPRAFDDVAFKLGLEQISSPVETELGWHIILRRG